MPTTYRGDMGRVQGKINYRLMKGKEVLQDYPDAWCYATIFNGSIPRDCTTIEVYHPPYEIPYTKELIDRWILVMNKIGFPIVVHHEKDMVRFVVTVADYKYKLHILSTLMIVRTLIEDCLTPLPEFFFQGEDEDPKRDLFKLMAAVHENKYQYARDIHMVTYNGRHIQGLVGSFDELMEQFEASGMDVNFGGRGPKGGHAVNSAWWGVYKVKKAEEPKPAPPPEPIPVPLVAEKKKPARKKKEVV